MSLETENLTAGMGATLSCSSGAFFPHNLTFLLLPPTQTLKWAPGPRGLCSWAGRAMGSEQHLASPGKGSGCLYPPPSFFLPWEWLPFWSCRRGL